MSKLKDDFNVRNKKVSEATYLEVRDIILKFKHQKAPVIVGITAEILRNVSSSLWRRIRGLAGIMRSKEEMPLERWSKEEMPLERTMGIECGIYIYIYIYIYILKKVIGINVTFTEE
jgi:hypothetical protein